MESYRSGHNGAVLKTSAPFGTGKAIFLVFPILLERAARANFGEFSPEVLSFFRRSKPN